MYRCLLLILALAIIAPPIIADTNVTCPTEDGKPVVTIGDPGDPVDISVPGPGGSLTLSNDSVYHLYGRVHIVDGAELYVENGTIFKGEGPGGTLHPTEPSALIIDRGGYAEMIGDSCCPIIMTYLFDDIEDPFDMPHGDASRGLWGGLIVLGKANIGDCASHTGETERHVEGIPTDAPDYDNVVYGCADPADCDDMDNSGIFRFISIRYGGHEIGTGNEINGLTMGAVGAGTQIDHIEVYHNLDDGYEWFGGTVCAHHLVSAFNGDDAFDYDQGFRGYGQYWFAVIDNAADNAGEHDGNEDPEDACPFARPDIANVTYLGPGKNEGGANNVQVLNIRDNAGAHYNNSIFVDFPNTGLAIEELDGGANPCGTPGGSEDSEKRLASGDLTFSSIFFWDFNGLSGTQACGSAVPSADQLLLNSGRQWQADYVFDNCNSLNPNNCVEDVDLLSYPPTKGAGANCRTLASYTLCPRPTLTSPAREVNGAALDPLTRPPDGQAYPGEGPTDLAAPSWYSKVPYAGAFDPETAGLWTDNWTFLHFGGYTGDCIQSTVVVDTAWMSAHAPTISWTADNEYQLYGRIHVKDGWSLAVEAGTVIKGDQPGGELHPSEPSALIIDRGGYAEMIGTQDAPIIMTYIHDNVDDPYDMPHGNASRGLWGGLIILGSSNIGDCDQVPGETERHIEGIPTDAWDYDLVIYGAPAGAYDNNDNSGIFRYISVRHGGHEIGTGNEINGVTMGAVGAGTQIDHIEVYHNQDDGYEWFGGTVSAHHLVSAFNGDDAFDYDQGFRGYGQFWFAIIDNEADNAGEHDGNEDPEPACPFARPDITNVTYIGPGKDQAGANNLQVLHIRDNAGAHYSNSIFVDFPATALNVEELDGTPNACGVPGGTEDSENRLASGDLTFTSIFFWDFAGLSGTEACGPSVTAADQLLLCSNNQWLADYVFGNCNNLNPNNCVEDAMLCSYPPSVGTGNECRAIGSGSLNPRPSQSSPVLKCNGAQLDPLTRPVDGPAYAGDDPDPAKPAWFKPVDYAGAFSPYKDLWTDKWTVLYFSGYTCDCVCKTVPFVDGDANSSGNVDIDDAVYLITYIFGAGPAPCPLFLGDANCSGGVDIDDVVYLITYIFGAGPPPQSCPTK